MTDTNDIENLGFPAQPGAAPVEEAPKAEVQPDPPAGNESEEDTTPTAGDENSTPVDDPKAEVTPDVTAADETPPDQTPGDQDGDEKVAADAPKDDDGDERDGTQAPAPSEDEAPKPKRRRAKRAE